MHGMPQPNESHRKLHQLAGTWVGDETMSPSPWGPGGKATGRYVARVDMDGFFVVQDYVQEKDGQVTFRGHGVYGWDDRRRTYTWFWVDSMGEVPAAPSRGQWVGDTLTFESDQGTRRGRYTLQLLDERTYRFTIESSSDEGKSWQTFMEGTYRKT